MFAVWTMLSAHGIVGAQLAKVDSLAQVLGNSIGGLNKTAESPFGVRARGVKKDSAARVTDVNALTDRARRISALEGDGRDQQMGQRMKQHVRQAREACVRSLMRGFPGVETRQELRARVFTAACLLKGREAVRGRGYAGQT